MSQQYPPPEPPHWNPTSYGAPPPPGPGYAAPGQALPPEHRNATAILVLGILSLVCCGLLTGIPAIVMGTTAMREIDASGGQIGGRGTVKAGWVCGIIGTAWAILVILFFVILVIVGMSVGSSSTSTYNS